MINNGYTELENLSQAEFSSLVVRKEFGWRQIADLIIFQWLKNGSIPFAGRSYALKTIVYFLDSRRELSREDLFLLHSIMFNVLKCDIKLPNFNNTSFNPKLLYSYSRIALLNPERLTNQHFKKEIKADLIFNMNHLNLRNSIKNLCILLSGNCIELSLKKTYESAIEQIKKYNFIVLSSSLNAELFFLDQIISREFQ